MKNTIKNLAILALLIISSKAMAQDIPNDNYEQKFKLGNNR